MASVVLESETSEYLIVRQGILEWHHAISSGQLLHFLSCRIHGQIMIAADKVFSDPNAQSLFDEADLREVMMATTSVVTHQEYPSAINTPVKHKV